MTVFDWIASGGIVCIVVMYGCAVFRIRRGDVFATAQAIFDRIEADAKARGCTQDISAYRKARQAFTHAALRGRG